MKIQSFIFRCRGGSYLAPAIPIQIKSLNRVSVWLVCLIMLLFSAFAAFAQDQPATPSQPATFDDVNVIAKKMFCPECENIPLDKCSTTVCLQWKQEIADRLDQGQSEEEIISYFVTNFGNRVIDIPQDNTLRTISLVGPWILGAAILIIGVMTLLRLRSSGHTQPLSGTTTIQDANSDDQTPQDDYRKRLERDLNR